MTLSIEIVKMAQGILAEQKLYKDDIDGLIGNNTKKALDKAKGLKANWTHERKIVGVIQAYAQGRNIEVGEVDGLWGVRTQNAFEQLKHQLLFGIIEKPWRPEAVIIPANPNNWPMQDTNSLNEFYGIAKPGGGDYLTKFTLPYEMILAWDPSVKVKTTSCHKKVKESLQRVLENVLKHYSIAEIKEFRLNNYGGCFNYRKMRGGTNLSTHSWGIALDFDPDLNQLKWGRDRASFARPEYNDWWKCWEEEGWVSLGRSRNFDWMHVQAAKLVS